jgi:hypothetical protein
MTKDQGPRTKDQGPYDSLMGARWDPPSSSWSPAFAATPTALGVGRLDYGQEAAPSAREDLSRCSWAPLVAARNQLSAAVLGASVIGVLATSPAALAQSVSEVVPGVWNYDVILPEFPPIAGGPPGIVDNGENGARDISNAGLAVGRVRSGDDRQRAFVYARTAQFGVPAATVVWLPTPLDGGGVPFDGAEALDVNESGIVAGNAGATAGLVGGGTSDWPSRAVLWRLGAGAGGSPSWQRFDPPNSAPHGAWPQAGSGFTAFTGLSADSPVRAVGYAGSNFGCFGSGGCALGARPVAFAVDVPSVGAPQFRTEEGARPGSPPCPRKGRAMGISRDGRFVVGARNTLTGCQHEPVYLGIACSPTMWDPLGAHDILAADPNLGAAVSDQSGVVSSECVAVSARTSGGAIAVGYALAPPAPGTSVPHAWFVPAEGPGQAQPLQMPAWAAGGSVADIEVARWRSSSGEPARVAVGRVGESAAIWFWDAGGWSAVNWIVRDVNSPLVLSPLWAARGIQIQKLWGVNEWGDAVGEAVAGGVRRPVILRASRVLGDLDWNGCVGASDLAILLGAWCPSPPCDTVPPSADLDRNGLVGASDLSILLGQWSCTQAAQASFVPAEIAEETKVTVDFAAQFVGLSDIQGYRSWVHTAPAPLREIVDAVMWSVAKGEH